MFVRICVRVEVGQIIGEDAATVRPPDESARPEKSVLVPGCYFFRPGCV